MTFDPFHREEPWLNPLRTRLTQIRFGTVHLAIHEGRVTALEVTEKLRMDRSESVHAGLPDTTSSTRGEGQDVASEADASDKSTNQAAPE